MSPDSPEVSIVNGEHVQVRSVVHADALAAAVKVRIKQLVGKLVAVVGLIVAGVGVGGPVGYAISDAYKVEKTVEKIVKVPVPVPSPPANPGVIRATCPNCHMPLILYPSTPGRTGSLPLSDEEGHDVKPQHEGPGRLPDPPHPARHGGGGPALVQPPKGPSFRPGSVAFRPEPAS